MTLNKKAEGMPQIINFIMALIVLAGGAVPLLVQFELIGELPAIPGIAIEILTIVAGILLLLDGFIGSGMGNIQMPKGVNIATAIIVLIGGVVPLLSRLGSIGELPAVPNIIFSGILIVAGILLLLDGIFGVRDSFGM